MRLATNDRANRGDFEEAITRWLPAVSLPGDTVFLFVSALVQPVPGEKEPLLLPADYMDRPTVDEFEKKRQQGHLSRETALHVAYLARVAEQAGNSERADAAVARAAGITQTQLAHWLQALAGRRIVLIFDTASARNFLPGLSVAPTNAIDAAALSTPIQRLKDLGQGEIAMLAACEHREAEVIRLEDQSLFSSLLAETIARAPGQMTLEQAYQRVDSITTAIFDEMNRKRRAEGKEPFSAYRPCMVNACSQPVLLKP